MRAMQAIAAVLIASFLSQSASAQTGVQHAPAKPDRAKTNAAPVQTPPAAPAEHPLDIAYGSFQRGYFITAFSLATDRVTNAGDPKAMTLLGELYANGLGVPLDYQRAAEWYRLAAARGDSNAMFALAMFALNGRAGPRDRQASTQWLAAAAKLGHPIAAYDLALLYIEGQMFPQDFSRAAELLRVAAQGGSPDAQYALGTFYKAGRGVPQDMHQAVQWWASGTCRQYRRTSGICHRTLQRRRRCAEPGGCDRFVPQSRDPRQRDRPRSPGAHSGKWPRRAGQSRRGGQMASDLARGWRDRSRA